MPYLDLGGIAAYYEQSGDGEPLVLLHGGFCSLETLQAQQDQLSRVYAVLGPVRPGQGRTADRPGPITFQGMVDDTIAYLDAVGVDSAHVVGFSDGAITGLLLALQHPPRLRSLVAISANLNPSVFGDGETDGASDQTSEASPDEVDQERGAYDRLSPDGPAHGDVVLEKLVAMWKVEPRIDPADLARVTTPTLILAGDRDVIPVRHTVEIAQAISGSQLCILPGAGHLAVREQPSVVNATITTFLTSIGGQRDGHRTSQQAR
jgi:pimeloyl-ACP methyl ester carboxylesterase